MSDGSCMTEPICNITVGQAITYLAELREMVGSERKRRAVENALSDTAKRRLEFRTGLIQADNEAMREELAKRGQKIKELEAEVERLEKAYDEMEQMLAERGRKIEYLTDKLQTLTPTYVTMTQRECEFTNRAVLMIGGNPVLVVGTEDGLAMILERWKKLEQIEDVLKGNHGER